MNIPYLRTPQDLERKYDLSGLVGLKENLEHNEQEIIKTNAILENFVAVTVEDLENIQKQVDGNITTYYYSGVPSATTLPQSEWEVEKYNVHLGDLYYDKDTGYAYRFYLDSETNQYGWVKITDSDVTEALAVANSAQDTADSKRRVFVVQPIPPYDVGDIWFKDNSDLYRCKVSRESGSFSMNDWIIATKYTDDTAANEAKAELNAFKVIVETTYATQASLTTTASSINARVETVENVANGKNKIFTTQPTTPYHVGDAYIKTTIREGVTQNLIYVCQVERLEGDYQETDFSLQPSYASASDLKVERDRITAAVTRLDGNDTKISALEVADTGISNRVKAIEDDYVNSAELKVESDRITATVESVGNLQTAYENDVQDLSEQIGDLSNNVNDTISQLTLNESSIQASVTEIERNLSDNTEKIKNMSSEFTTNGLRISSSQSDFNALFNNAGVQVFDRDKLTAIFNQNGSGVNKLIIVESMQFQNLLGYKRELNTRANGTIPVISFFWNNNLIETLEDLKGGN